MEKEMFDLFDFEIENVSLEILDLYASDCSINQCDFGVRKG